MFKKFRGYLWALLRPNPVTGTPPGRYRSFQGRVNRSFRGPTVDDMHVADRRMHAVLRTGLVEGERSDRERSGSLPKAEFQF